ncbi:CDP-alcohol phosphatidyltransferase family protein [Halochromatium glycolicum]|uniref:CDP-diacylglycerol--glycerol-3-phosphate 3-phosphatidyltransferase n=1 Tax=Halochromatium glycolicum TaxID=85075 RepID=A0AAJ0XBY0_9GAMM|nr:CDP-alcohol phosphatidyltransferase family protein [Halochromatium glycolicum]MBK1706625.1 hypothetical protein [Halochromatium glycolicum]
MIKPWNLPNLLSGFRLLSAPLLLVLAVSGEREAFLWLLALAFFTDAVDGMIARTIGQTTPLGARLDSWADVAVYVATTASLLILWPERVREEWVPVVAVVVSFMTPAVMGLLRFGRFTSYHTILVKIAVVATVIGLFAMLLDVSVWPFRIAAALAVLAGLEELIITMILREERSNITSLWQVLREQRGAPGRSS